ncbi:hypothetical protein GGH96_000915 [Coemansia sp. RSA 1972]|nr:hypothetical protein GGH96_000915 [Coemansia sp. RSA 1972]
MSDRLEFPDGVVRVTPLTGVTDTDSISLATILDAQHLQSALITSFIIDMDWLLSHLLPHTPLTLIADQTKHIDSSLHQNITWCNPEFVVPDVQIMHTKLMLLVYTTHVRFVISTGNLVPEEWTVVQNSVFIQDFPLDYTRVFAANEFSTSLALSLHDLSVPFGVVARLNHVDFARARARIVTTVPTGGNRVNANMESYGMLRLAHVISQSTKAEEWEPDARLYCIGSSLGKLNTNWLRDFYMCAHGWEPQSLTLDARASIVPASMIDIAVAFPTHSEVTSNVYGKPAMQYVMAKQNVYANPKFPKSCMFRVQPRTDRTVVHAKAIVARTGERQNCGWVYLGSHNFTPAAWGRLRRGESPYYNNYEMGVVLLDVRYECRSQNCVSRIVWENTNVVLPFSPVWVPYGRTDAPYFNPNIQ